MDQTDSTPGYLTGQLLVAMPTMQDPRFEKSAIYMCIHNADGAMGLIVNRVLESLTFRDLLVQSIRVSLLRNFDWNAYVHLQKRNSSCFVV